MIRTADGMAGPVAGVCLERDRNMTLGDGTSLPARGMNSVNDTGYLRSPATCGLNCVFRDGPVTLADDLAKMSGN